MKNRYINSLLTTALLLISGLTSFAQTVKGIVIDSLTNEPLPYIAVFYEGKGVGGITDLNGEFSVERRTGWNELSFSAVGYQTKIVPIPKGATTTLNVELAPDNIVLNEVIVKPGRERYSRKNNPAVELMRKVIAAKKENRLEDNEYFQYSKYQKITMSLDDMTPEKLEKGVYKNMEFMKDQIEFSEQTQKFILPISVEETASQRIYRKNPKSDKMIIRGVNASGVNDLFATGDMLNTILKDYFNDVDIKENNIRLLHRQFISPISSENAISFYKYYIMDTVYVDKQPCYHLSFVPNNSQDVGFTGHLYVLADSSYAVKRCTMNLPANTGVNFIRSFNLIQDFKQLSNGEWVLDTDDMLIELTLAKFLDGLQIQRITRYSDFSFDKVAEKLFKRRGDEIKDPNAMIRDEEFWQEYRPVPLSKTEEKMDSFVERLENVPGVKYVVFALKALIENSIETGTKDKPSKIDIVPVNTIFGKNDIEGVRLRASVQTTAKLNPHLFFKGYYAYGFKDKRSKYMGEFEYSFNKKEFLPHEFPKSSITVNHQYDLVSASDKFLDTDKDNIFVGFKTTEVDHMSYVRNTSVKYENETYYGLKTTLEIKVTDDEATGSLQYIRNDDANTIVDRLQTTQATLSFRYVPGETFVNTKQRRVPISRDAPRFTLSHTMGFKDVFGGDYNYNITEIGFYKRFWISSWGKVDFSLKGGAQWNKVPFPLLNMPAANLSYILQPQTFNLINNMEFMNDRYAALDANWDMGGKIFNRIPLIKKLKWREAIGFKMLYGTLTDKNNPYLNPGDGDLFLFPTRNGETISYLMDSKMPYMECSIGIRNIFKLIHIDYVRRLNYLDNPNANKWGIRFMVMMIF
ncbi:MAG: DUF5686 family protein [Phocaeicola sp.]